MTRAEHLEWCKKRALEYVEHSDIAQAVVSMMSDMDKHPDTSLGGPTRGLLMMVGMLAARDHDTTAARRWVEGFN